MRKLENIHNQLKNSKVTKLPIWECFTSKNFKLITFQIKKKRLT